MTDKSDLGISKTLLQMNFMRRSLITKEKTDNALVQDLLPDPAEYVFKLPKHVDEYLNRKARILKTTPNHNYINLFEIHGLPAGFRAEFGAINPPKPADATVNMIPNTFSKQQDRFFDRVHTSDSNVKKSKNKRRKTS